MSVHIIFKYVHRFAERCARVLFNSRHLFSIYLVRLLGQLCFYLCTYFYFIFVPLIHSFLFLCTYISLVRAFFTYFCVRIEALYGSSIFWMDACVVSNIVFVHRCRVRICVPIGRGSTFCNKMCSQCEGAILPRA